MKPRLGKKGRKALVAKKAAKAAPKKKAAKPTPVPAPQEQEQPAGKPGGCPTPDCCNRENENQTHAPECVSGLGGQTPGIDAPGAPAGDA